MIKYTTIIEKDERGGDKTGWTFIIIPASVASQISAGSKKSFRVKGLMDGFAIEAVALLPVGEGHFMLPMNAAMRKGTGKRKGDKITLQLEADTNPEPIKSPEFMMCLEDEPAALAFFNSLTRSQREYFLKWIESAKTEQTKAKRIAQSLTGLTRKFDYGTMIRYFRDNKDDLPGGM